jgi:hypothetical protein
VVLSLWAAPGRIPVLRASRFISAFECPDTLDDRFAGWIVANRAPALATIHKSGSRQVGVLADDRIRTRCGHRPTPGQRGCFAKSRERVAHRCRRYRVGRQPVVRGRVADCCIDPAVRNLMHLDAGDASAAMLLAKAKRPR